jgi:tripartite-type tricarboxylate transporter receptor subunit TctC
VRAPADGYTILFTTASLAVNVTLYGNRVKFDPLKDLAPVSWISSTPLVLVVHPSVPAKTPQELVALAKKAGNLNAASNGAGTTSHLSIEMLKQITGVKVAHIPFKGGGPSMASLVSGETDFLFATGPVASTQVKASRVRALAVTTGKKSSAFPDLPTMTSIYPGLESDNWYAMFFPAGTPKAIVDKLNSEIAKALKAKNIQEFMPREALDAVASSPEELQANFKREIARYAKIIKAGNIKLE